MADKKSGKYTLKTIGISKKKLKGILKTIKGISYCDIVYGVDLHINNERDKRKIRNLLKPFIYGKNPLETAVGKMLIKDKLSLAVAESCTGGMLGSLITGVKGSSKYFRGGIIAYDNSVKEKVLKVKRNTLTNHGSVSLAVAQEMAEGVRKLLPADIGIGITGIAGPGGGSKKKPVGLVYIALSAKNFYFVERFLFSGNRQKIRLKASYNALNIIRVYLSKGFL